MSVKASKTTLPSVTFFTVKMRVLPTPLDERNARVSLFDTDKVAGSVPKEVQAPPFREYCSVKPDESSDNSNVIELEIPAIV
jgi:hypothetical protein